MIFTFTPKHLTNYAQWAYYAGAFTPAECASIVQLINAPKEAETFSPSTLRKSKNQWLSYSPETAWIFERLTSYVLTCNAERWAFDLTGFFEPLQLTRYDRGDFYGYHQDSGPDVLTLRKLSVVVQLTDPAEYEGGELQFAGFEKDKVIAEQGSIILFPSYNPHRVTEVTKGTRHSLVSWVTGTPYR